MSLQRTLVRLQTPFPDNRLVDPGEIMDWEGLNWKLEPLDPAEREEWAASIRDDARVEANRMASGPEEWRWIPADEFPDGFEEQTSCAPL